MSADFRPGRRICARDLFDGQLVKFGVHEWVTPQEDRAPNHGQDKDLWVLLTSQGDRKRCLTDGQGNYLWVSIDNEGSVAEFTGYGRNDTNAILAAVAETFETEIFSEDEPQFWGFETNEELYEHIREISSTRNQAQPRVPDDMTEFVICNGEDCLCSLQPGPSFLLPGSINPRTGTVMK